MLAIVGRPMSQPATQWPRVDCHPRGEKNHSHPSLEPQSAVQGMAAATMALLMKEGPPAHAAHPTHVVDRTVREDRLRR